jgi:hypothetical protein
LAEGAASVTDRALATNNTLPPSRQPNTGGLRLGPWETVLEVGRWLGLARKWMAPSVTGDVLNLEGTVATCLKNINHSAPNLEGSIRATTTTAPKNNKDSQTHRIGSGCSKRLDFVPGLKYVLNSSARWLWKVRATTCVEGSSRRGSAGHFDPESNHRFRPFPYDPSWENAREYWDWRSIPLTPPVSSSAPKVFCKYQHQRQRQQ